MAFSDSRTQACSGLNRVGLYCKWSHYIEHKPVFAAFIKFVYCYAFFPYRLKYRSCEEALTCFWWYSTASWAAISELVDTLENELLLATLASDEAAVILVSEAAILLLLLLAILASEVIEVAAILDSFDELETIAADSLCIISAWAEAAACNSNKYFLLKNC